MRNSILLYLSGVQYPILLGFTSSGDAIRLSDRLYDDRCRQYVTQQVKSILVVCGPVAHLTFPLFVLCGSEEQEQHLVFVDDYERFIELNAIIQELD